ncbi:MAG: type II secretion system protein [Lachnospiraceae bacterium]|nr:type II secretion system protein [Lachnospiraceae bacterium]
MVSRDRTRAFLTEFIIVILFFSVAAVIVVQLFAAAYGKSKKAKELTDAGIIITNVSEQIKAMSFDEFEKYDKTRYYDENWIETTEDKKTYILTIDTELTAQSGGRGMLYDGTITITKGSEIVAKSRIAKSY